MGGRPRLDREAQDASWVPPRHRSLHRSSYRPDAAAGLATSSDIKALPRPGRAWRPRWRPLSAITVSHIHRTLRKALADAVDVEQLLAANPAARSKRPKSNAAEPIQVWTVEQLGSFLAAARSHRLFAFYRLAAYTGARRGELLYLRWSAVDLDAAEVTFGGSTAVVRGQRVEGTTKGGRSRAVSLDRETVAVLREHHRAANRGTARRRIGLERQRRLGIHQPIG